MSKQQQEQKEVTGWGLVLKIIITVATALAGIFGVAACGA